MILLYHKKGSRLWKNIKLDKNLIAFCAFCKNWRGQTHSKNSPPNCRRIVLTILWDWRLKGWLLPYHKNLLTVLQVINKYNKQSVYWALRKSRSDLYETFKDSYTRTYALID